CERSWPSLSPLIPLDRWAQSLAHQGGDLAGLGVAAEGRLGEDQLAVEDHLEAAVGRRHQLDGLDDRRPPLEQLVRQTDGTRHVVSGNAELDADAVSGIEHVLNLPGTFCAPV